MVFRAMCVGWVLVLASWCWAANPWADLCRQTEQHEIDGEEVSFALHLCGGLVRPFETPDGRRHIPSVHLAVSIVQPGYTGLIWTHTAEARGGTDGVPRTHIVHELWWDEVDEHLWVARVRAARTGSSSIDLWRLELDREAPHRRLELVGLAGASGSEPVFTDSVRFERADEGVRLVLVNDHGEESALDLPRSAVEREPQQLQHPESWRLSSAVQEEVRRRTSPKREPSLAAWRRFVTEAHAIGGEQVQFMVHRCSGSGVPVFAKDSDAEGWIHSHGYMISSRSQGRVDVLWGSESVVPNYASAASTDNTLAALHWDGAEQRLWVALVGTTNHKKSRVVVWRLDLERDAGTGALSVGQIARMEREYSHEPRPMGPLFVDATRFTEEHGVPILNLYHHDRPKTRIEVDGRMEPSDQAIEGTKVSEETRAAIRKESQSGHPELARSGPHVALQNETEVVELNGLQVRFMMHRLDGTYSDSRFGAAYEQGYMVSILPTGRMDEAALLWYTRSPLHIHIPVGLWGSVGERTAVWWDEKRERLWVAAAFTSSKGVQRISLYRIGVERDSEGTWSISSLDTAVGQYTSDEMQGPDGLSETMAKPRIESMRFIRAADGGVDLWVAYPEGLGTMLDLPRNIREVSGKLRSPRSESLLEFIREDLAEREAARE